MLRSNLNKNKFFSDDRYSELFFWCDGRNLSTLWNYLEDDYVNFHKRRDAFLWLIKHFLLEGRIKLHKNGIFFDSSIEDQIKAFRQAWPETDNPYPDHPDADFYLWFYDPECPAGIAWRKDDGSYEIAD